MIPTIIEHRRGFDLDTFVVVHHGDAHPEWLEKCIASLEGEPTNIRLVLDSGDHMGSIRAGAYSKSRAPFISFVDDDDWLEPGALAACMDAIDAPDIIGAYADLEYHGDLTGVRRLPQWSRWWHLTHPSILQPHVHRREPMRKHLAELARWPVFEDWVFLALMAAEGNWRKLDFRGYHRRVHAAGAHHRITDQQRRSAVNVVARVLAR